jgi:hypothetical protein
MRSGLTWSINLKILYLGDWVPQKLQDQILWQIREAGLSDISSYHPERLTNSSMDNDEPQPEAALPIYSSASIQ